jgi:hypothetical protein
LVTLLRVQLAKLEEAGRLSSITIDEPLDNEVFIAANTGVLSVWLEAESGRGSWNLITTDQTADGWSMSNDGNITLDGGKFDIESAAAHFAAKLVEKLTNG